MELHQSWASLQYTQGEVWGSSRLKRELPLWAFGEDKEVEAGGQGAGSSDIPTSSLQTEGKIPEEAFKVIP